ncbi:MAG: ABC transporter permease [Opitutaceae bacterium]
MVPTLAVVSIVVFAIVQLPPGDFATVYQAELEEEGSASAAAQIQELRSTFHLDDTPVVQYLRWSGLYWFTSFRDRDTGLLEGNLGRSMEFNLPVATVVGDRIALTVVVSLATILLTWTIAIPIGIYSAVRQYSIGDYALTLLGFLGMSVPGFLLALVLMFLAHRWFGLSVSGLFSPAYETVSGWSWPKILDLLKHIWVPVVVLGLGGTAGMIRVMRANLLDELRKPYVTAARARGVPAVRLLLRYPVRLALNPFVSGVGGLFPELMSGGAIVAIVLSLPMIGPVLFTALLSEDVQLAASMLLVMSFLGIAGTLISDLLLMALDPRIRLQGASG